MRVKSFRSSSVPTAPEEKPIATANGVSINIHLAEPVIFLQGYDHNDTTSTNTTMLRGVLHLRLQKRTKIKAVTLRFRGTATTMWPEGIPPQKTNFKETQILMSRAWPFFNAQLSQAGSGADFVRLAHGRRSNQAYAPHEVGIPTNFATTLGHDDAECLFPSSGNSSRFKKAHPLPAGSVVQDSYRNFDPGDYAYSFELPLDGHTPETTNLNSGVVKYELEATIERIGALKANLQGKKEVVLVRTLPESSLGHTQPISICKNWEDQLHYEIVVSGNSFALGSSIPISLKLTPLAKIQCYRVRILIVEQVEYFCSNKQGHRTEPPRDVLLYEKRADASTQNKFAASTHEFNTGGEVSGDYKAAAAAGDLVALQDISSSPVHLEGQSHMLPTEMEFTVQLPHCREARKGIKRLHFDTKSQNVQVSHWIKIAMDIARTDPKEPGEMCVSEITAHSPLHILSCRANQANTTLPAYSPPEPGLTRTAYNEAECGCPGASYRHFVPYCENTWNLLNATGDGFFGYRPPSTAAVRDGPVDPSLPLRPNLARPPTAHVRETRSNSHVQRPVHVLRAPSFEPPAFDDEQAPPALVSPPPDYHDVASPTAGHGLADYFARLADVYAQHDHEEAHG